MLIKSWKQTLTQGIKRRMKYLKKTVGRKLMYNSKNKQPFNLGRLF